jgi:hypothetical protein
MRWIGLLAVVVAGCGGVQGGGAGLPDVTARLAEDVVVPPRRGDLGVAVRSFVPGEGGSVREAAGSRCVVTAGPYRAAVETPTRVVLPDLGPDAPPVRADCVGATARGSLAVAPYYPWPEDVKPSALERILWGGGWWRGYQESGPMRYPDLDVVLDRPLVGR